MTSTKGVHKELVNDATYNIARHGSVGTLKVEEISAVKLVAKLRVVSVDALDASLCREVHEESSFCFLIRRLSDYASWWSFFRYVGDAGNTSLVDACTPLGATAVVTPGSAGYLLWECCILASFMWYGHNRDLFPTAEGCMGSRLPNVTLLHWACLCAGVRQ